jgi:hypothetical protein
MENGQFTNRTYVCNVTVHMLSLSMTVCLIVGMFSQPDVLCLNPADILSIIKQIELIFC